MAISFFVFGVIPSGMRKVVAQILLCICVCSAYAQNTVGLLGQNSSEVSFGYNLFYSHFQSTTYLVDTRGQVMHLWEDNDMYVPGNSVFLTEEGNLIRCKRNTDTSGDPIFAGGGGAIVDVVDWEGDVLSSIEINNDTARLHHDVAPMANGNILLLAWHKIDSVDAVQAGRNPELISEGAVWSEMILEWNPTTDEIVWEWFAWDHLVQDHFGDRMNFGVVSESPEKIDVNYTEHGSHPDWLHINAIAYNEVRNEIVVSVPYFNELWVIDHSTTTAEARTSSGGNSNKGGDLIYRWGNPQAYQSGDDSDKVLFFQHDVHWVNPKAELGDDDYGVMAIFNNRVPGDISEGLIINTLNDQGDAYQSFALSTEQAVRRRVRHPENSPLSFSRGLSSIQVLPNGNVMMFAGRTGFGYEMTPANELVWSYRVPLLRGEIARQGTELVENDNLTFRMERYSRGFPGFEGRTLSSLGLMEELGLDVVTSVEENNFSDRLQVYPNPVIDQFHCVLPAGFVNKKITLEVVDAGTGQVKWQEEVLVNEAKITLNSQDLSSGLNYIRVFSDDAFAIKKVIRLN